MRWLNINFYVMSHLSSIFTRRKVDIPNRSGFDLSFENLFSSKVGTLTPVLCEEVIPNETFSLGYRGVVQLPPMATNFFGRVDMRLEAFFVPNRILWGGWQNFWTMPANNPYSTPVVRPLHTPSVLFNSAPSSFLNTYHGAGSLSDFLGYKLDDFESEDSLYIPNLLPWLAYHKIYDDWYRNSKIQKPVFVNSSSSPQLSRLPWVADTYELSYSSGWASATPLGDGVNLFSLRQRNWAKDYFTTATLYPQANGQVGSSSVSFDTSGASGEISIAALRSANVLQRWYERNNIAGERYSDQIKAQYGVLPSDAFLDRPLFLGSSKFGVYSNSVSTTAETSSTEGGVNPFTGFVGSKAGQSQGLGEDTLIDKFTSTEHGYIMVLASLVPHAYYSTGVRRQLFHSRPGDFAIPLLQGLGEQPIFLSELGSQGIFSSNDLDISASSNVFGYTLEHAEYKYHDDEVHGLFRVGESLESFALSRGFSNPSKLALGTSFIQIPTTAMDNVCAVASGMSSYGYWADFNMQFKRVSPLSEYVIPTLGDLTNTHKESIPVNGRML